MDRVFFEDLELLEAEHNLDVGSGTHADQTGRIMTGVEKVLISERPDCGAGAGGYQHGDGRGAGGFKAAHQGGACGSGASELRPPDARGDQPRGS